MPELRSRLYKKGSARTEVSKRSEYLSHVFWGQVRSDVELWTLSEEATRVVVKNLIRFLNRITTSAKVLNTLLQRERIARFPISALPTEHGAVVCLSRAFHNSTNSTNGNLKIQQDRCVFQIVHVVH